MVKKKLHDARKTYDKSSLDLENTRENPFKQFDQWYHEAEDQGGFEANAMVLSTANAEGHPSLRVVLLKEYSDEGFVFFSNYNSRKGAEMDVNPHVSILFFYESMQRQIRITGKVIKLSDKASEEYFKTRPLESQYGAMISNQSHPLKSKSELEDKFKSIQESNKKPQRPKHWGGYIVVPSYFEFWQGRPNRLHDRVCYTLTDNNSWDKGLIAP